MFRLVPIGFSALLAQALVLAATQSSFGQTGTDNCIEIIRQSRAVLRSITSENHFNRELSEFCREYHQASTSGGSTRLGFDYKAIGISFGSSRDRVENLARRYCRSDVGARKSDVDYEYHLQRTDPDAYAAYISCKSQREAGVEFRLMTYEKAELSLRARFAGRHAQDKASVLFRPSKRVSCRWLDAEGNVFEGKTIQLEHGDQRILECLRRDSSSGPPREKDSVDLVRVDGAGHVVIPWKRYNLDGEPYETISEMTSRMNETLSRARGDLETMSASIERQEKLLTSLLQRSWQNRRSDRALFTKYTNKTNLPLGLAVTVEDAGKLRGNNCILEIWIDGVVLISDVHAHDKWRHTCSAMATVPPSAVYQVKAAGIPGSDVKVLHWSELSAAE